MAQATTAPRHLCREAPFIIVGLRIAQCVRCRWLIDSVDDEVLASTEEEIASTIDGLSVLASPVRLHLDRIVNAPVPAHLVPAIRGNTR